MIARRPLVLFDGACNLCNAWVQWLIRRDRRARFYFASLQSEAGRTAVLDAGSQPEELPDSIALIDEEGLHVRSTAALRVLRGLRFPYSLCALLLVLPRALCDGVYDSIARRRYSWFGRRDICMLPTPALRARFLDAEEPRPVLAGEPAGLALPTGRGAFVRGWFVRFAIVYVIAYMLPFPLTLLGYLFQIPAVADTEWLAEPLGTVIGVHAEVTQSAVTWLGRALGLGSVDFTPTGSGDRTAAYLDLIVDLVLSFLVTGLWAVRARGRRLANVVFDVSRVLARYYLATTMLTYGWAKLFPLQFPEPGPDRLLQAYGDSSPMGLAWTFLGASTAYQMFGGLMELIGGYLLFWRRTAFLGALITLAVMMNVAAINYFYDVPVKLFSTHLILVALFIAAPDLPRLLGVLVLNVPTAARSTRACWSRSRALVISALLLKWLVIGGATVIHVQSSTERLEQRHSPSALKGLYRVQAFTRDGVNDRANSDADRWVRVGLTPPWIATIQRATGEAIRLRTAVDEDKKTLSFFDRGGTAPESPQFTFTLEGPDVLRLEGEFEGAQTTVVLQRQADESLLTGRGFRWVNEYPFNR